MPQAAEQCGPQAEASSRLDLQSLRAERREAAAPSVSEEAEALVRLLIEAAVDGSEEEVETLLDEDSLIDGVDWLGRTSLMHAAREGHDAVVLLLIERDAQLELTDRCPRMAPHTAWLSPDTSGLVVLQARQHSTLYMAQTLFTWSF